MAYDHNKSFLANVFRKMVVIAAVESTPLKHNRVARALAIAQVDRALVGPRDKDEKEDDDD